MPKVTEIDMLKNNPPKKDQGKAIVPIPMDIETPTFQHKILNLPKDKWVYHTQNDEYAYVVCRYYNKQGDKIDLPWTYRKYGDGRCDWDTLSIPSPRILFNLHHFTQKAEAPVLVSEGEKAAEAASKLFPDWISTTSSNGAGNAKSCDWSPCESRHVVIWPDNDDAGFSHAKDVARLCLKAGAASVRIVQIPPDTFAEKWDLADDPPDDWTVEDLQKLIDEAEEVVDPLDGLLERCETDKGAAFQPDVIEALADLKKSDKAEFQKIRHDLKKAQVRVRDLDNELRQNSVHVDGGDMTEQDLLLSLAFEAIMFHSPEGKAYAYIPVLEHYETWAVRSEGFKKWLTRQYFKATGSAPSAESFNAALNTIEAMAHYEGEEREVFIRVAELDGKAYVDLCNSDWEIVEIDTDGWRVIKQAPVHFRRTEGMLPIPLPKTGGSIDDLRPFLNVKSENDFILTISWLVAAFRSKGPYPLLVLSGEQGTAKSSFTKTLKNIVDPNKAALRTLRADDRDLFIAANNGHVLAFDNISKIPDAVSDALCRLATGGGYATRQLYTDQGETLFNATRPIILNGINDVVVRPDLADRSIVLTLERIPSDKRRPETELKTEFDEKLPGILGVLFDMVSLGLKTLPDTKLDGFPRMADFALWATACETAISQPGAFMVAYDANRLSAIEDVLDASPVAVAVQAFIDKQETWTGTASGLLDILSENAPPHDKSWPKTPRALSGELTRVAPFLRQVGIEIETGERANDRNRTRLMAITKNVDQQPSEPSRPSEATDIADGADE